MNAVLATPDWRARLTAFVESGLPRESHVALLIVDENGSPLWRSPGPGPPWPLIQWEDWRRELRRRRERVTAEAREATALRRETGRRALSLRDAGDGPYELRRPRIAEPKASSDEKALAETRAAAEARAAVEARRVGAGWRVVSLYGVGPESRGLTLVIAQDWGAVLRDRAAQKRALLLLSLCVVVGVAAGTWVLVGRTLSPIRRLALQAGAASVDDLQVRLKAPSGDAEVVELVDTLNGLLARLAETAAVKGRFYAAASHELRTPLQALSGHLEVALSRGRTGDEYETFLQEAARQTGRLTSLVKDLLLLHQLDSVHPLASRATADHGYPARPREPVDLAEVCDGALGQLAPLIEARGLRLQAKLAPGVEILAIPTHAEILVRNLLENAAKYASSGGAVTLSLTSSGSRVRLELCNECPPVPEWNPEKLFEPFYRPDAARTARTGGNGLGLAICRAIAAANGWTVTLQQEPHGVRAIAAFGAPLAAPNEPSGTPLDSGA